MPLQKSKVLIAGAGPGDLDLVTVGLMRALASAEVVLYDALVNPELLNATSPDAVLVDVGKSGQGRDCRNHKQEEINALMKRYADEGKRVVRLKGGDPLIFGRGSEECEFLRENGIPYEILPGISSASAGPAYAGIPLTHREISRSVCFATGHLMAGETANAIRVPEADTLVFLMGVKNLDVLVDKLVIGGRSREEACALIENATTPKQRTVIGTLATIVSLREANKIRPPALFVVGKVAELAGSLGWFEKKPLFGKTFILTRAKHQLGSLAERLRAHGAQVVLLPMIEIQPFPEAATWLAGDENLKKITDIIFTSENAVRHFFQRLFQSGKDARALAQKTIWVIGPRTGTVLRDYGLQADQVPEKFQAEGLSAILPQELTGHHFLLPRAKGARTLLLEEVHKRGGHVTELVLYESLAPLRASSRESLPENVAGVCFTSASTVRHFKACFDNTLKIPAFTIGEITAAAAGEAGFSEVYMADHPSIEALVEKILELYPSTTPG